VTKTSPAVVIFRLFILDLVWRVRARESSTYGTGIVPYHRECSHRCAISGGMKESGNTQASQVVSTARHNHLPANLRRVSSFRR
jgi:hypothetical protein